MSQDTSSTSQERPYNHQDESSGLNMATTSHHYEIGDGLETSMMMPHVSSHASTPYSMSMPASTSCIAGEKRSFSQSEISSDYVDLQPPPAKVNSLSQAASANNSSQCYQWIQQDGSDSGSTILVAVDPTLWDQASTQCSNPSNLPGFSSIVNSTFSNQQLQQLSDSIVNNNNNSNNTQFFYTQAQVASSIQQQQQQQPQQSSYTSPVMTSQSYQTTTVPAFSSSQSYPLVCARKSGVSQTQLQNHPPTTSKTQEFASQTFISNGQSFICSTKPNPKNFDLLAHQVHALTQGQTMQMPPATNNNSKSFKIQEYSTQLSQSIASACAANQASSQTQQESELAMTNFQSSSPAMKIQYFNMPELNFRELISQQAKGSSPFIPFKPQTSGSKAVVLNKKAKNSKLRSYLAIARSKTALKNYSDFELAIQFFFDPKYLQGYSVESLFEETDKFKMEFQDFKNRAYCFANIVRTHLFPNRTITINDNNCLRCYIFYCCLIGGEKTKFFQLTQATISQRRRLDRLKRLLPMLEKLKISPTDLAFIVAMILFHSYEDGQDEAKLIKAHYLPLTEFNQGSSIVSKFNTIVSMEMSIFPYLFQLSMAFPDTLFSL